MGYTKVSPEYHRGYTMGGSRASLPLSAGTTVLSAYPSGSPTHARGGAIPVGNSQQKNPPVRAGCDGSMMWLVDRLSVDWPGINEAIDSCGRSVIAQLPSLEFDSDARTTRVNRHHDCTMLCGDSNWRKRLVTLKV